MVAQAPTRSVARIFADAAFTVSAPDDAPRRLQHVLALLGELIRCDAVVVVLAQPLGDLGTTPATWGRATEETVGDARRLLDGVLSNGGTHAAFIPDPAVACMAVPLLTPEADVLGLVLVRPSDDHDQGGEEGLQRLAVVGSLISGYLAWLGARAEMAALVAREREARRQAELASRTKEAFLANLSHELRTPLNAIAGWSSLLTRGGLNETTTRRAIEVIDRSAKAEARLIDDVLDMSRIVSGKLRMEMRRVELGEIVSGVVDAVQPVAAGKGVTLSVQLERPLVAIADPARLHQVLYNLVSNAIKFTPRGGCADVVVRRAGSSIEFAVTDTGMGIAPDFLPRLFDRFSQADDSVRRQNSGLGLGLAIVKHIVESHGGTVEAESAGADRGSTFRIRIPAAPLGWDEAVDEPEAAKAATRGRPDNRDLEELRLGGLRVLVVDDDADTREVMHRILTSHGALVSIAASALEASEALGLRPFDLLLVDIGMPGEDGHSFLRRIRSEGTTTRAMALTAYGREDDKREALFSGFDAHVTKPIEPRELIRNILKIVDRA